jgi:hypothetical protein
MGVGTMLVSVVQASEPATVAYNDTLVVAQLFAVEVRTLASQKTTSVIVGIHERRVRVGFEVAEVAAEDAGKDCGIGAAVVYVRLVVGVVVVVDMPTASGAEAEAFRVVGICSGVVHNMCMADSAPLHKDLSNYDF